MRKSSGCIQVSTLALSTPMGRSPFSTTPRDAACAALARARLRVQVELDKVVQRDGVVNLAAGLRQARHCLRRVLRARARPTSSAEQCQRARAARRTPRTVTKRALFFKERLERFALQKRLGS